MFSIGLTDHLEGPLERCSADIYREVTEVVLLADRLGVQFAWFAEHHAHAHQGHLPAPLLYALHLAGKTERIRLGTAIICLNLHHPQDVAEQVAIADLLASQRLAVGFGSGSTPEEAALFDAAELPDAERHERFEASLRTIFHSWGAGSVGTGPRLLPNVTDGLTARCWIAVNSVGAARIAGKLGLNVLFSHLRTPEQYIEYQSTYSAAGGRGKIAANRPVFVGSDDASAWRMAEGALRMLWQRFQREGKIAADLSQPHNLRDLCHHPINFIVGGPASVAQQLQSLHQQCPFDVANVELRWAGLSHQDVCQSLRLLMEEVMPRLQEWQRSTHQTFIL